MPLVEEIEILEPSSTLSSSLYYRPLDFSLFYQHLDSPSLLLDVVSDIYSPPFDVFDRIIGQTHIAKPPFSSRYRRARLGSFCDPVGALALGFDRFKVADRKYTWTGEIRYPERKLFGRKYKLTAEIEGGGPHELDRKYEFKAKIGCPVKTGLVDKKYKWTAEIKAGKHESLKNWIKGKQKKSRGIKIEEPSDTGALVMRQAFAKRAGALADAKGKAKELSPVDAASAIQTSFRAHLIRRSQALRSLRQLAVAKAKVKEIRVLFNNFCYRRRIARDAEESKRFSEKVITLLLTVDAIQGADLTARAARRSMMDELEAMLDAVDPHQVSGESGGAIQRRRFHLHEGTGRNEIVAGVADVIQMLDQAENFDNSTFEVCL